MQDIVEMFKTRDKDAGVEGLNEMVRMVVDMAMEKDAVTGMHKCEAFGDMDL